jgi:hypothetical protein
MKRRILLVLTATVTMIALAAWALQQRPASLLVLEWAKKAPAENPPVAVLIELGLEDHKTFKPRDWSGSAKIKGAKVVHREGYRFRPSAGDKLIEPDGWQASSHRGLRVPAKNPAVSKMEPIATVGVVLHLADVTDTAMLEIDLKNNPGPAVGMRLKDVLAGKPQLLWDGAAAVRLISTATPVALGKTEDDFPAACYGPDGTLWVAYISYTVRDDSRRIESPPYKEQPKNFKDLYTPEFGDQLWVKSYRGGKWSEPIAVTGPNQSLERCAIAAEGNGRVWVSYSAFRDGMHDVYWRSIVVDAKGRRSVDAELRFSDEKERSDGLRSLLNPIMCTQQDGNLELVCQSWGNAAGIRSYRLQNGTWVRGFYTGSVSGIKPFRALNTWHPAVAAPPDGQIAVAHDTYSDTGDYNVAVKGTPARKDSKSDMRFLSSASFEARPSIAYDPNGRLWLAYEEGPQKWGKDYGAQDANDGNPLYNERSVRVVCVDVDGALKRPIADLPTSKYDPPVLPFEADKTNHFEKATRYAYPKIGIDGKGRIWLTYRQNLGSRYTSHNGAVWRTYARRLDGDKWSEPIEIHHSDGLLDDRPVLLPHQNGGLIVIHNTDGRFTTPEVIDNQIYMSYLNLPGEPVEPKLVVHQPGKKDDKSVAAATTEAKQVKRIRDYRIDAGGKKLMLLRGEYHRHTEISWDGAPDGSLEDMFRYAIDAAAMDWIGNGDHDNGAGREYSWWLIQKFTDAYHVKGRFTPMFTYERSVSYPHGHRNVMFAKRGIRTLPRLAAPKDLEKPPGGVHPDDTKMLYRYLREFDGICAVHTSATGMGTDWRDNDPVVEPIVEIYQGDRMSYELQGAPRAGFDVKSGKLPINVGGWFPEGFIDNALNNKKYKLGFQASSDHWSTHISYFIILAEKNDRDSLLAAVKRRHCYGATDNIIVDFRSGSAIHGDEIKTREAPMVEWNVIGTGKIDKIDILRDSEVVQTFRPKGNESKGDWRDVNPKEGVHYYYIRVLQTDGEIAWASPIWIDYRK